MDDIVLADFDYSKLDQAGQPIRIRLSSTAVGVHNAPDGKGPVDIGYVQADTLHRVQGKQCVLACYNMIIPYLMPELPERRRPRWPRASRRRWSTSMWRSATGSPSPSLACSRSTARPRSSR